MRILLIVILSVLSSLQVMALGIKEAACCKVQSVAMDDKGGLWLSYEVYGSEAQTGIGRLSDEAVPSGIVLSHSSTMGQICTEILTLEDVNRLTLWNIPGVGIKALVSSDSGVSVADCGHEGLGAQHYIGAGMCTSAPVFHEGKWYMAVGYGDSTSSVYVTSDNGCTWESLPTFSTTPANKPHDTQPYLIAGAGGLDMYTRSCGTAWSYKTASDDFGATWNPTVRFLPHPDREFCISRFSDGRLLMVRNGRLDQCLHILPEGLYAYMSDDDGQTWYGGLCLDQRPFSDSPCVVITPNGRICIFFNHNYRGKNQIIMAMTNAAEIDAASGSFSTFPRIIVPVLQAGQGTATFAATMDKMLAGSTDWASVPLRVATYNIQYLAPKAPQWEDRIPALKAVFDKYDFDLVGSQEPDAEQMQDIMAALGDDYAFVSVNRDNDPSKVRSSHNPIIYRKSRLELLDWGTFWYTDVPGKAGYGASSSRFCTWAKFHDKVTGMDFCHLNSHFDHLGIETRVYSSYVLTEILPEISDGLPTFCTGDFNSDEKTRCYKEILYCGYLKDAMTDGTEVINQHYSSMQSYKPEASNKKNGRHIDHIFYTHADSKVLKWELIMSDEAILASDHLPIYMDWIISNK